MSAVYVLDRRRYPSTFHVHNLVTSWKTRSLRPRRAHIIFISIDCGPRWSLRFMRLHLLNVSLSGGFCSLTYVCQ